MRPSQPTRQRNPRRNQRWRSCARRAGVFGPGRGNAAPSAAPLPEIPVNYAVRLLRLRRTLRLTQTELAQTLGVASKAVVYQWETRKRRPCPILWARVELLESGIGA